MQHKYEIYQSKTGIVSASSEHNSPSTYGATRPLNNQLSTISTDRWITTNGITNGWWQYEFTDNNIPILCGLMWGMYENSPTISPKKWQLLGWDTASSTWVTILNRDEQAFRGYSKSEKDYCRMFWFTENTTAYKKIRINIDTNQGGGYAGNIQCIRFYEHVVPGMHKYDTVLYATDKDPFMCSVSCGLNENGTKIIDKVLSTTNHVTYDGKLLAENTTNYMYIVPQNSDGVFPTNLDSSRAVEIPNSSNQKFYLYSDHRKIHYGTEEDIAKETLSLLYSRYTENKTITNDWFEHDYSIYKWPTYLVRTNISTSQPYRGSPSSYDMTTTSTSWISINNADMSTVNNFPTQHCVPHDNKCTIEIDFKWTGQDGTVADGFVALYDNGWYNNCGWAIRYSPRRRCFSFQMGSPSYNGMGYSAPCDIIDNNWHTFAVTLNNDKLYFHVDGKCIGHWNGVEQGRNTNNYQMIGRMIYSDSESWVGYVNNFRITLGTALYCSSDYTVSQYFNKSLIPDKTLWFDNGAKIVKEYNADLKRWIATPMLPIGSIETGRRENLLTDQPTGTYANQPLKDVVLSSVKTSGQSDAGDWAANQLLRGYIHNASVAGWHTTSNSATTDHWTTFELVEPKSFDRIYKCAAQYAQWFRDAKIFKFYGSNVAPAADGTGQWKLLIDQTNPNDWKSFCGSCLEYDAGLTGINPQWYQSFDITDTTPYKYYKLELPKRSTLKYTWLSTDAYSHVRILPFLRNGKPEVLSRNSVMVNKIWTLGPIPCRNDAKYRIPVPTDNIQYEVSGYVIGRQDRWHGKRLINNLSGWYGSDKHIQNGEIIYMRDDQVWLHTGNLKITLYSGSEWGMDNQNNHSAEGNYYLKITRLE